MDECDLEGDILRFGHDVEVLDPPDLHVWGGKLILETAGHYCEVTGAAVNLDSGTVLNTSTMPPYNAEISAGSLLPLESRRIAGLLLTTPDEAAWRRAIEVENILQKKTPATARRQATLLRKRLTSLDPQAWAMISGSEHEVSIQMLLAASVKHSHLLGDFLLKVYAHRQRRLEPALAPLDWHDFLAECAHQDPAVAGWSESTRAKLFQVIVRILVEAKYLQSARSMALTPRSLHPEVRRYLTDRHETYVLDCLERAK